MANTLKLEIVTPDARAYSDDVDMVTIPGAHGEMGIYPQHVPLLTQIVAGELVARKGSQEIILAVGDGFVQITGDRVAILTDMAMRSEGIDETQVEEARRRAEARLSEKVDAEEMVRIHAAMAQTAAQLKVARRRRK